MMFAFGVACAVLAVVDCCAAIYFSMTERLSAAWIMLANFSLLGAITVFGVFG